MSAQLVSIEKPADHQGNRALEVHATAMAVSKNIKSKYLELFEVLSIVETEKIYFQFDVPSLFVYCTELLELSRSIALDFIIVVRTSVEVPELAEAIRSRGLSIPKARKICSVLTKSNHRDWIDLAMHCSARVIEKTVAMANPKEAVKESLKFVSGERLELKLGVSEEWTELLTRTKDLLSQKSKRAISTEEALQMLMSEFCRKSDPVEKAKRAKLRKSRKLDTDQQVSTSRDVLSEARELKEAGDAARSRYITASVDHEVDLRDGGQCVHVDRNGKRCESRRWLAKHHVHEFAKGGVNSVENLETLCWVHHQVRHRSGQQLVT